MDYDEYLQELRNTVVSVSDGLTSVDERIDYVARKLDELSGLQASVIGLTSALTDMGVKLPGRTRQLKFQHTLETLTAGRFVDRIPYDCILTSVGFHFPPGCNGLVDVSAGYGNEQAFPTTGYLSLDDATPVYPTSEALNVDERIWVEIVNTDSVNAHTITVTFMLQERRI